MGFKFKEVESLESKPDIASRTIAESLTVFVIGLIRVDIQDLRGKKTAGQKLALEEE